MSSAAPAEQQPLQRSYSDWPPVKTALRGVSHAHALFAALAAGIMLILAAPGRREKLACAAYVGKCSSHLRAACAALLSWAGITQCRCMQHR